MLPFDRTSPKDHLQQLQLSLSHLFLFVITYFTTSQILDWLQKSGPVKRKQKVAAAVCRNVVSVLMSRVSRPIKASASDLLSDWQAPRSRNGGTPSWYRSQTVGPRSFPWQIAGCVSMCIGGTERTCFSVRSPDVVLCQ